MKAIDALKRLERAGSEHSRATKKLGHAANEMVAFISSVCPRNLLLPRGYMLGWAANEQCDDGSTWNKNVNCLRHNMRREEDPFSGEMQWIGDAVGFSDGDQIFEWLPRARRKDLLTFSKDIAEGLLDEIADFLEQRAKEDDTSASVLRK